MQYTCKVRSELSRFGITSLISNNNQGETYRKPHHKITQSGAWAFNNQYSKKDSSSKKNTYAYMHHIINSTYAICIYRSRLGTWKIATTFSPSCHGQSKNSILAWRPISPTYFAYNLIDSVLWNGHAVQNHLNRPLLELV